MRKPIIAGNWKMNMLPGEAVELVGGIWERIRDHSDVEVVVCPPFVDIPAVSGEIKRLDMDIGLGAQNMHWGESGAFTGEISASMLKEFGVTHVIIGHSERRQLFGEEDQGVNRKLISALEHGFTPIMCVGETAKQRDAGDTENHVTGQVNRGLFEVEEERIASIVIAYEPIWAIGTGKAATARDADEVTGLIRDVIGDSYGSDTARAIRIQYGGSVNPGNISELMAMSNIDGALVGGASLKAADFSQIVRFS